MKPLLVKIDFIDLSQIQGTVFTFLAPGPVQALSRNNKIKS